jgi:hypothetical protein
MESGFGRQAPVNFWAEVLQPGGLVRCGAAGITRMESAVTRMGPAKPMHLVVGDSGAVFGKVTAPYGSAAITSSLDGRYVATCGFETIIWAALASPR